MNLSHHRKIIPGGQFYLWPSDGERSRRPAPLACHLYETVPHLPAVEQGLSHPPHPLWDPSCNWRLASPDCLPDPTRPLAARSSRPTSLQHLSLPPEADVTIDPVNRQIGISGSAIVSAASSFFTIRPLPLEFRLQSLPCNGQKKVKLGCLEI